jgi:hypothetical protein
LLVNLGLNQVHNVYRKLEGNRLLSFKHYIYYVSTERNKITFDKYNRKPKGIEYCLHDVKQVGQQRGHN